MPVVLPDAREDSEPGGGVEEEGRAEDKPLAPHRRAFVTWLTATCRGDGDDGGLTELEARDAEVGVYNWAISRCQERRVPCSWASPRFVAAYLSKARSVAANLDDGSYVRNARLLRRLRDGEFLPHDVATMPPENLHPERWRHVVEAKMRRDEYISNAKPMAMTNQFKCSRCKKRECSFMELQMRSCDEPASIFVQCLSCGHKWRVG